MACRCASAAATEVLLASKAAKACWVVVISTASYLPWAGATAQLADDHADGLASADVEVDDGHVLGRIGLQHVDQ